MKDPAFLFYSGDFKSATELMTDEEVGIYIRLICTQHQHGSIEKEWLEEKSKGSKRILKMFITDEDGSYYNESIRAEIQRRKNYSESRRANKLKKSEEVNSSEIISNTYEEHMTLHMETETETRTKDITREEKECEEDGYSFSEFWEEYGVKKNRNESERKFKKLSKKDRVHIKTILPQYKKDTPEVNFRKHPTTFLNQKTWLDYDETEVKTTSSTTTKSETKEQRYNTLLERIKQKPFDENRFTIDERRFMILYQSETDRFPPDDRKMISEMTSLTKEEQNIKDAQRWTI